MSAQTPVPGAFGAPDYAVFALMLLVSAAIGVYYAWVDRDRRSSGDFLTGGRGLSALPVSMSLTASFMSAITVLGNPAEVYRFGANLAFGALAYTATMLITSEVFLPVFYRLSITSTFEYLERRFNKASRMIGTLLFIAQTVLYTGIVIYAPALALTQVTGLNLWGAVISTGVVCTFYCTVGGLKAVVWTDVFQVGIMLAGFLAVIVRSVMLQGGFLAIVADAEAGGRLNMWDFDINPLRRHTFWTITVGGVFLWVGIYGINQAQVQRYISCKSIRHARLSLYINLLGLCCILLSSVFLGMCLYSVYKNCDPYTAGQVSASDQLVPYLVMDIFKDCPGLPGLFVAAVYSGSLSTVSSSINALAAVTVEDLIKPYTKMSETHLSWTSKGLSVVFGISCIGMAGLASLMQGVLQAAVTIFGVIGGPLLGLFTLGILCPFANSKGALSGLVVGLAVSLWVGVGAQMYPPSPDMTRPLKLSTEGCNFTATAGLNWTSTDSMPTEPSSFTTTPATIAESSRPVLADNWYSLSYLYFGPVGTLTTLFVGILVSLMSGGWKSELDCKLTLRKEDTTSYSVYMFIKERVSGHKRQHDLTKNRVEKFGTMNMGFHDVELT